MRKLRFWLLIFFTGPALAASPSLPDEDPTLDEKVRKRQYAGGRDEEGLKVQQGQASARRKLDRQSIHKQVFDLLEASARKNKVEATTEKNK